MIGLLGAASTLLRPVRAQATGNKIHSASDRPGDEAYTPTKLEWAALELQVQNGHIHSTGSAFPDVYFTSRHDGKTILCTLVYTRDTSAAMAKTQRDRCEIVFAEYAKARGWSWLRLQFKENVTP